jgi:uncharacterized protein YjbI with pentapeptide repeats
MTVFFLVLSIIVLVGYLVFLTQRRDQSLLKTPPIIEDLPNVKYNQTLRELNLLQDQPMPQSKRARSARIAEQYYLKEKLDTLARQTEGEQRAYNIACKEMEIAWQDYYDLYNSLTSMQRLLSIANVNDLGNLRKLFLDARNRVAIEKEKITARGRVKNREDQLIQEREDEIERKSKRAEMASRLGNGALELPTEDVSAVSATEPDQAVSATKVKAQLPNRSVSRPPVKQQSIENAFEEIYSSDDSSDQIEGEEISSAPVKLRRAAGPALSAGTHEELDAVRNIGQDDFPNLYPDYSNCSYIDESLSLEDLGLKVVRDATFVNAFFVSVQFQGVHQYQNCNFMDADFSQSIWQPAVAPHRMLNCQFFSSHFEGASFEYFAFYNCQFNGTSFVNARFKLVKFVNCKFENCLLDGVDFSKTVMSTDMLENIDFTSCERPPKNWTDIHPVTDPDEEGEAPDTGPEYEEE